MSGTRVFIGRLPKKARESDVERFFKGFGRIRDISLKKGHGFVEFKDPRDADDSVYELNNREILGERVTVEHARAISKYGPPVRTKYRVIVENLSSCVSWQELKDYFREAGEVTYADAHMYHKNKGVVDFATYDDLKRAVRKMNNKEINGRRIRLIEDTSFQSAGRNRSRSRSPRSRSRTGARSRTRSARRSKSRSRSARRSASRSRSRSRSARRSASRSRSPRNSRSRSQSPRRSKSRGRSEENGRRSRSASKSPAARASSGRNCFESRANSKYGTPVRTKYRVIVKNLSTCVSWQHVKGYLREAGEVTYAAANKKRQNEGVVDFATYDDMKRAVEKMDNTEINGRRIRLIEDTLFRSARRSRSRSRSPRCRSRNGARSRSARRSKSRYRSARRSASRSRSRSGSARRSALRSRSPRNSRSRS